MRRGINKMAQKTAWAMQGQVFPQTTKGEKPRQIYIPSCTFPCGDNMAEIIPFEGIHYNQERIADLSKVIAPPYDVISPEMQNILYERHPQNVIRLILGKDRPGDGAHENKYIRAGEAFRRWLTEGILVADSEPSLYIYEEEYSLEAFPTYGKKQTSGRAQFSDSSASDDEHSGRRSGPSSVKSAPKSSLIQRGIIAAVKIEEYEKGIILPHEDTMPGPKQDRLALMRSCKANLSPIFGMYTDPSGGADSIVSEIISSNRPAMELTDDNGISHRVWSFCDKDLVRSLERYFLDKQIYIADGHHRYETAMVYRDEIRSAKVASEGMAPNYVTGNNIPADYVMMWLVNMDTQDLTVFPTHRMLENFKALDKSRFLQAAERFFTIEEMGDLMPESLPGEEHSFLVLIDKAGYFSLIMKDDPATRTQVEKLLGKEASSPRGNLDVTLLHEILINHIMMRELGETDLNLSYTRDPGEAQARVMNGRCQMAFFLSPTRLDDIRSVVKAGQRMPQKSTYFYPKPLSGLIFRDLSL